jgi:hypothetical protein
MWFLVFAGILVVAAAAVGIAFAVGGGDEGSGSAGPCTREAFPALEASHIETLPQGKLPDDYRYNSFPPSSGYHSGQTAIWNVYDDPVPEENLVHNLEHGGIAVQYGSNVPPATVAKIVAWYQESPEGMIVTPLPPLDEIRATPPANVDRKIFLTAWTHVATCTAFDEDAFTGFRDDYRGPDGDAPEKFPLEALQPGST